MLKEYVLPKRILSQKNVVRANVLLQKNTDMAAFDCDTVCKIKAGGYILLDFGCEYNGGVRIISQNMGKRKNSTIRIRFGESAMECNAELGFKNATNDHSVRDQVLDIPWVGILEYGHTGYRFIRIDNYSDVTISFMQIEGVYEHSGKQIVGSFKCSDNFINDIYNVGVRTIYLNNNDLITDGIKRDRLVWIGDMHPESSAILRVFGADKSICNSLDYIKRITPPTKWMNNIPTYTMWWIKILHDYYVYTGDREYLSEQVEYLKLCIEHISSCLNEQGKMMVKTMFIDWPSHTDKLAQECGMYAMLSLSMKSAATIFALFSEKEYEEKCLNVLSKVRRNKQKPVSNKQMSALLAFSGECDAKTVNKQVLSVNPLSGLSTFLGYYVLIVKAMAGDMVGALKMIKKYYGGMLKLGATTLWEDFDYSWIKGGKKLDAILKDGEYDIHGDNGGYCYKGYRHSLCHGWSAGLVPFLSEYVLGVKIGKTPYDIIISPDLGNLSWAEGKVATAGGTVYVKVEKTADGIKVDYKAPSNVKITVKK